MNFGELTEQEVKLIEQLRLLKHDKSLKYLPDVLIANLNIFIDRDKKYNATDSSYESTYQNGDAEMFINTNQVVRRVSDIMHNGNNHLECEVPMTKFEDQQILNDLSNWSLMWQCHRITRLQGA